MKENVLANFSFSFFMMRLRLYSSRAAQQSPMLHSPDFCTKSGQRGPPLKSCGAAVQLLWDSFPGQESVWEAFPGGGNRNGSFP